MQRMKKTIESTGTEFLICFSSRPSSSSKSKTLMSPGHPPALSSSLSRRLRSSGSLKSAGAASPIFSASSRRRSASAAIDAAEPSSPKVTCIGQVKIKAKKKKVMNGSSKNKKKKIVINRSRSVSEARRLRKTVSICDALNCFVPSCGWSSCYYSTTAISGSKRENEHEVFRRDDRIGKLIEFVESREEKVLVFEEKVAEEEEGRVSVCIPPRNALLLMRCRSDPVRMAALSSRFWDSPAMRAQCQDEAAVVDEEKEENKLLDEGDEVEKGVVVYEDANEAQVEGEKIVGVEEVDKDDDDDDGGVIVAKRAIKEEETELTEGKIEEAELREDVLCGDEGEDAEIVLRRCISCSAPKGQDFIKAKEAGRRRSFSYREKTEKRRHSFSSEKEARRSSFSSDKEGRRRWSFSVERPAVMQSAERTTKEEPVKAVEPKIEVEEAPVVDEREKESGELPDCLLLMMYEPKLSSEVSKETWVCSTDFLRWHPHQATNQPTEPETGEIRDGIKNANAVPIVVQTASTEQEVSKTVEQTPSSPMQAVSPIERKVPKSSAVGALPQAPYEQHFVLTRCKSEPGKSSARLVPDSGFWKSRHQPIGTAGLGF